MLILLIISCASTRNKNSIHLNDWTILKDMSDEFNQNKLDTTKWKIGLWYDVSGDFAFKKDNISVKNRKLHLTAKVEKFNQKEYTIGALESKFNFPEETSLIRVRAKLLSDEANVCSAIWLQSWPEIYNNPNPEIDIIEYFSRNEMHMNLFTWDKDEKGDYQHVDFNGQIFDYKKDLSDDYHIYGFERSNGRLKFYYDDQLVYDWEAPNSAFSKMPRHVILSLEGHRYTPNVKLLPSSFDVDWVRIYKK